MNTEDKNTMRGAVEDGFYQLEPSDDACEGCEYRVKMPVGYACEGTWWRCRRINLEEL